MGVAQKARGVTLLFVPQPIREALACGWCGVRPGDQHDRECPAREDETDFPAHCSRCGVTYVTCCDCDSEDER